MLDQSKKKSIITVWKKIISDLKSYEMRSSALI